MAGLFEGNSPGQSPMRTPSHQGLQRARGSTPLDTPSRLAALEAGSILAVLERSNESLREYDSTSLLSERSKNRNLAHKVEALQKRCETLLKDKGSMQSNWAEREELVQAQAEAKATKEANVQRAEILSLRKKVEEILEKERGEETSNHELRESLQNTKKDLESTKRELEFLREATADTAAEDVGGEPLAKRLPLPVLASDGEVEALRRLNKALREDSTALRAARITISRLKSRVEQLKAPARSYAALRVEADELWAENKKLKASQAPEESALLGNSGNVTISPEDYNDLVSTSKTALEAVGKAHALQEQVDEVEAHLLKENKIQADLRKSLEESESEKEAIRARVRSLVAEEAYLKQKLELMSGGTIGAPVAPSGASPRVLELEKELQEAKNGLETKNKIIETLKSRGVAKYGFKSPGGMVLAFKESPFKMAVAARRSRASGAAKELKELRQKAVSTSSTGVVTNEELKNIRLLATFKATLTRFREAVAKATGYTARLNSSGTRMQMRSQFATHPEHVLEFSIGDGGSLALLETPFTSQISEQAMVCLKYLHSIPAFTATITQDLFQQQTFQGSS